MEFKNLIKFYLDEHGRVDKTEDTSFIVSGSENETALELLIANTPTTPTDIVVYASFKRADGFVISNRSLEFKGITEDSKYYDFLYTFKNGRILDIAGQLEVSFTIKSGNKTINSVSNALYVRRNVKPNLETTTEEEFYQEGLNIVRQAQQDINQHKIESENKFNSKVDKETYEKDMPTKLDKVNNVNQVYVTDNNGKQTTLPYSKNFNGGTIVQRNDDGQIDVKEPTEDHQAVNKGYVDQELAKKVNKTNTPKIVLATDNNGNVTEIPYSVGSTENGNALVQRDDNNCININDPVFETHAVNKRYGDNAYLGINKVNATAQPNTIPIRDSNGRMTVATPTEDNHAANKKYVQDQIKDFMNSMETELILPYDTLEQALSNVHTKIENNKKIFVSITNEDGTITYTSNKAPLGTQILIREEGVEDFWLSRKEIGADDPVYNFFTAQEAKANLDNYYDKTTSDILLASKQNKLYLTGEEIENGTFENGDIIYCTFASEFFNANTYYVCIGSKFKPISTGGEINITPLISEWYLSTNPTGITEIEVGRPLVINKYWGTLKKSSEFSKVHLVTNISGHTAPFGEAEVTSSSFLVENLNYSLPTSGIGLNTAMTLKLIATLKNGSTFYSSKTITTAGRQYFGILETNPTLEVLTSEIATEYFGPKTSGGNTLKTIVDKTLEKNISLKLPETPSYVWFLVPRQNMDVDSIKSMSSGGFDFPFIKQNDITITNSYGVNIVYEVYRSTNKVYGTVDIILS